LSSSSEIGTYPEVDQTVDPKDVGFDPQRPHTYMLLGRQALDAIRLGWLATGRRRQPRSFLDLPSGSGRVVRFLRAEYPEAEVAACDIEHRAVDFCAQTFGATPILGHEHPAEVELPHPFDVIWCGSLLTHLNAAMWDEFFDFFHDALGPGGVLLATVTGRGWVRKMRDPEQREWAESVIWPDERRAKLLDDYDRTGFGFAEYPTPRSIRDRRNEPSSYGVSLAKPSWLWAFLEQRPLKAVIYLEEGWAGQDVVGLVKR
jgi:SAM-dependent methyltransferase